MWLLEKCPFDEISRSMVIRGSRFVLIEIKLFHVDEARYFSFEFVKFYFGILFIFFSCCVKPGADFFVVADFIEVVFIGWE